MASAKYIEYILEKEVCTHCDCCLRASGQNPEMPIGHPNSDLSGHDLIKQATDPAHGRAREQQREFETRGTGDDVEWQQ